ncbi:MAG: DNA polymerase III subunit delta [Candidatus Poribacteria bacterium]|nr:DNA polymerase III subunit delta [Candidatus Poribacteria bacterium]MDE0506423.1 DNA polymerase III subunit delta [Candidatus Poribacteria bacterium]
MKNQKSSIIPNIAKEIQSGTVQPVYLLCGEEDYLIEETLKKMLDVLLDEPSIREFNLDILDGVTVSIRDVLSAVEVYPMMSDWRVVVVRESTVFQKTKRSDPLDLLRSALDAVDESPRKAVSIMTKVLEIPAQEIAEQSYDFKGAVSDFERDNGDTLTPVELGFLNKLPEIARQVEDLQNLAGGADDAVLLTEWLEGDLPTTSVLVFTVKGNVDGRSRLVRAIEHVGRCVTFDRLESGQSFHQDPLFLSVSQKLGVEGKKITPRAFNLLRERTDNDLHIIFESLKKIIAFVGDKVQIDEEDVRNLVSSSNFENIFALTDAIGKRAVRRAMESLHSIVQSGEPPIKINALIARQIRLSLQAKLLADTENLKPTVGRMNYQEFVNTVFNPLASRLSGSLPQNPQINLLKQNPYAAYKIFQCIPYFDTSDLILGLEKTLDADMQLKSSRLSPDCILEQLVFELCDTQKVKRKPATQTHYGELSNLGTHRRQADGRNTSTGFNPTAKARERVARTGR